MMQFDFAKDYEGFDLDRHGDMVWRMYTELPLYRDVILGGRADTSLDVLQRVSPDILIARFDERFHGMPITVHLLYLVVRVKTEVGINVFVRSIPAPEVGKAICSSHDVWGTGFLWMRCEIIDNPTRQDRAHADYCVHFGGKLSGDDREYLNRWLVESLCTLLRAEVAAAGRPALEILRGGSRIREYIEDHHGLNKHKISFRFR